MKLTAGEVRQHWKNNVLPRVKEKYEADGIKDRIARSESFHNYIDMLYKDGQISEYLYDIIALPKECEH